MRLRHRLDQIAHPDRLESVAERKLNQSWRAHGGENFAESRVRDVGKRRISKIRMVPDVEEIRSEAQLLALGDPEILEQREIPVLLEGSAVNIAA